MSDRSPIYGFIVVVIIMVVVTVCCAVCKKKRTPKFSAPVVITSATHNPSSVPAPHMPYPPQNVSGVNTAPYPMGGPTGAGYQPFPMPQPSINTGFQSMPQPGYPPYPMHNPVAPYPPEPITPRVAADPSRPPSYDQVVNADAYQRQDAYNPNFKSQQ